MKTITAAEMYYLDKKTIMETGISGRELMQRAGIQAAKLIIDFFSNLSKCHKMRFVILAGSGNNGGDAFVVADYLHKNTNAEIIIYSIKTISELKTDSAFFALKVSKNLKIISKSEPCFKKGDILIDGLLGIGGNGDLKEPYKSWIEKINTSGLPVVALDIPSGLNADNGAISNVAVKADLTISMAYPKVGMILNHGPELCGVVKCVDIGIPTNFATEISSRFQFFFENDVKYLTRRPANCYKYSNGKLLIIAGSKNFPGAPILTAEAAVLSGAGVINLAVPESANIPMPSNKSIIYSRIPDSGHGVFSKISADFLNPLIKNTDAVVIGPGLTQSEHVVKMIENLNFKNVKSLWDADALNIFSENLDRINIPKNAIITPHQTEFSRIMKACSLSEKQRLNDVPLLANFLNCIVLLKGNNTLSVAPNSPIYINSSGTSALATAGTGDILAGFVAGIIAQNIDPLEATCTGAFIHGAAAEISNLGIRAFSADSLLKLIPVVMQNISPFA